MLRTTDSTGKTPDKCLSLTAMLAIRAEAFAHVRHHSAMVLSITNGIEQLDAALLTHCERSVDEMHALITAARRLTALLELAVPHV